MFIANNLYTKKDIYKILEVPNKLQGGNWNTGHTQYKGKYYVFVNIGVAGRTGHDHKNSWDGDVLVWSGKAKSHLRQPTIIKMTDPSTTVHIFTRKDSGDPYFTFAGIATAQKMKDVSPVVIHWEFSKGG